MKFRTTVSSDQGKNRKKHFSASSSQKRILMSSQLSSELAEKYHVRSMPIRKDDEVSPRATRPCCQHSPLASPPHALHTRASHSSTS